MTWKQLTERDCREWKLSAFDPHDRDTWRSGVKSAMRAASQLPGRGPTVVDIAPVLYCIVLLFYVHGKHLRSCRDGQLT